MRIVYLHQYFNSPDMVGGTRSYSLARRLVRFGHEVHVVTTDREGRRRTGGAWRDNNVDGIHVHWISVPYSNHMSNSRRILAFLTFAMLAARRARKLRGDVVFASSTPLTIAIPAVYAARRSKAPLVFEVRDLWPAVPIAIGALRSKVLKSMALWLERFAYRNSTEIVALAPGMRDAIAEVGFPRDLITVIPNGADLDIIAADRSDAPNIRSSHEWLGDRKLVLFCGSIGRANGVAYLSELSAKVEEIDKEIRFVVIGDGAEKDLVEADATTRGILGRSFFMMGEMAKEDAARWLCTADMTVALFTGPRIVWKDATQNKFFDSLAAGKPIANNFDGWQCQIAVEQEVGLVLPRDDIPQAAQILCEKLSDESWMADASASASRLARTTFSMDTLCGTLETVLVRAADRFEPLTRSPQAVQKGQ